MHACMHEYLTFVAYSTHACSKLVDLPLCYTGVMVAGIEGQTLGEEVNTQMERVSTQVEPVSTLEKRVRTPMRGRDDTLVGRDS